MYFPSKGSGVVGKEAEILHFGLPYTASISTQKDYTLKRLMVRLLGIRSIYFISFLANANPSVLKKQLMLDPTHSGKAGNVKSDRSLKQTK